MVLEASMCSVNGVMPREPTDPLKGSPPPPFIDTRRDGYMYRGSQKSSFLPELWGYNSRVLWEAHCGVWRRAWWLCWVSSLTLRRSRQRPANPSRRRGRCCRVYSLPNVAWWHSVGPAGQGLAYTCAPAVARHAAVPDPHKRGASVSTKEVRESRGGPGPLEGGGPGLRLLVLSIPP